MFGSHLRKFHLFRGLLNGEIAKTDPFYVDIDLTRRCNLKCVGCIYHSPYVNDYSQSNPNVSDISVQLVETLCRELDCRKTRTLILQGSGEPFMHPGLFDIISISKKRGFQLVLVTNGTLLNQENTEKLITSGLGTLKVSLWATSPEQYQEIHIGTDSLNYHHVFDGIKHISELKTERKNRTPEVILYYAINRANYQNIDEIVDLAHESGCDGITFSPMANIHGKLDSLTLNEEEEISVKNTLIKVKKQLRKLGIWENISWTLLRYKMKDFLWKYMSCTVSWFHARIRVDGSVQPCGRCDANVNFGNLHDRSFREIWNSEAIREFRRQMLERKQLSELSKYCDCANCCFVWDMNKINQILRWTIPLNGIFRSK